MEFKALKAISPVDGRYRKLTEGLSYYFSEAALIDYRIFVEIRYFMALCEIPLRGLEDFDKENYKILMALSDDFSYEDALEIKEIEKITNHDVKAVEYFLKQKFDKHGLGKYKEFIHFGLTSQDINNTAQPLATREAWHELLEPLTGELMHILKGLAVQWKSVPMLARTHGQPASPTKLGKEILVFHERLHKQLAMLKSVPFEGKFGGATGNFNAHYAAYPDIDWVKFANDFLEKDLGLKRQQTTTQIEHYDMLGAFFDNLKRINTILIDLDRDMWTYISMDYFKQRIKEDEVGSSAMPHKVNPIDFENSEGNLGIANALLEHLSAKLPVSRLQRDLTDSTVTRNVGVPLAHMVIGIKSLVKGLNKLILNEEKIRQDLTDNWTVVAEAIQTILRRENYPNPYEALKHLTRTNKKIDQAAMNDFIQSLDISDTVRKELMSWTPFNYTGKA